MCVSFLSSVAAEGRERVKTLMTRSVCCNEVQTKQHLIRYFRDMHKNSLCGGLGDVMNCAVNFISLTESC